MEDFLISKYRLFRILKLKSKLIFFELLYSFLFLITFITGFCFHWIGTILFIVLVMMRVFDILGMYLFIDKVLIALDRDICESRIKNSYHMPK